MERILINTLTSAAVVAVLLSPLANATNGYFKIGGGAKNKGLAGTGIAYGQHAVAGATNPATFGGGLAIHFTPRLTLAADVGRILYSGVDSISNDGPTANEFFEGFANALATANGSLLANALGKNDGFGFGWDDVWVYRIGVDYAWKF